MFLPFLLATHLSPVRFSFPHRAVTAATVTAATADCWSSNRAPFGSPLFPMLGQHHRSHRTTQHSVLRAPYLHKHDTLRDKEQRFAYGVAVIHTATRTRIHIAIHTNTDKAGAARTVCCDTPSAMENEEQTQARQMPAKIMGSTTLVLAFLNWKISGFIASSSVVRLSPTPQHYL